MFIHVFKIKLGTDGKGSQGSNSQSCSARPQVTDIFFVCGFPLSVDSIYMESRTMDHSNSW